MVQNIDNSEAADQSRVIPTRDSTDPRAVLGFEIADLISIDSNVKQYLFEASKTGESSLVTKEDFPLGLGVSKVMETGVKSYVQNPNDPDAVVRDVVASNVLSRFQKDYFDYSTEELQALKEELVNGAAEYSSIQYKASKLLDDVKQSLTDAWCAVAPPAAEKVGLSGLFNQEPEYKIVNVPGTRWMLPEKVEPLCPQAPPENAASASTTATAPIGKLGS